MTCVYVFMVNVIVECPSNSWTTRGDTPAASRNVAAECRRSSRSTTRWLNPILRGLFFDRDILRAGEIDPVYTYNRVIRRGASELEVDLVPTLADALGRRLRSRIGL